MKKTILTGALLCMLMTWNSPAKPNLHPGRTFLSESDMLAITATYPANLSKKEDKKGTIIEFKDGDGTVAGLMKDIAENVTAMQTKCATKDELEVIRKSIPADLTKYAESGKLEEVRKGLQDQFNDLTVKLLNSGRMVQLGMEDGGEIRKLLVANKESIGKTKTSVSPSVNVKFSAKKFWGDVRKKAASNMTESNNLLGTDPIMPLRMPGIHFDPRRPKHLREVINQIVTDSPVLSYAQETGYTDGSGMRAQGSAAGQSDFTITRKEVVVQALSTFLTITKEMMEDTDWIENYIDTRVISWMLMQEDLQLWSGNGTAPNITGIQPLAQAYDNRSLKIGKSAGDNMANSINYFDILNGMCSQLVDGTGGYYTPTAALMHPDDYLIMSLARNYYGSYQFPTIAMGGTMKVQNSDIVQNTVVTRGNALVGDFQLGATLAQRDGMEITFSNQHVDNFTKGFITVMVEERLGLVVHNPNAFVYGNFASGEASGSI